MITHTVAPAKINWTLEVLGKRDDGYHEIRTILQTVELHDEISAADSVRPDPLPQKYELVTLAAGMILRHAGRDIAPSLRIDKRIPLAAGLGGGSTDAAATLRLLNHHGGLGVSADDMLAMAAELGSDVSFFLRGGTALAEGRGEVITPLPDAPQAWLVLLAPGASIEDKTRRMYGALQPGDFSDGSQSAALASCIETGGVLDGSMLCNAFERAAFEAFDGLARYRDWMLEAGAASVHLAGAGPALFALASGEPEARAIRARLNRARRGERVHVVRTVTASEATLVWQSA